MKMGKERNGVVLKLKLSKRQLQTKRIVKKRELVEKFRGYRKLYIFHL